VPVVIIIFSFLIGQDKRGDIGKDILSLSEIELRYKRLMASISDSIAVYWLPNDVRAGH